MRSAIHLTACLVLFLSMSIASAQPSQRDMAAHRVALTIVQPDTFALARLEYDRLRGSELAEMMPGGLDRGVGELLGEAGLYDFEEYVPHVDFVWVAVSPGEGNWDEFLSAIMVEGRRPEDKKSSDKKESYSPKEGGFGDDFGHDFDDPDEGKKESQDVGEDDLFGDGAKEEMKKEDADDDLFGGGDDDLFGGGEKEEMKKEAVEDDLFDCDEDDLFGSDDEDDIFGSADEPADKELGGEDFGDDGFGEGDRHGEEPIEIPPVPTNVSVFVRYLDNEMVDRLRDFAEEGVHEGGFKQVERGGQEYYQAGPFFFYFADKTFTFSTQEPVIHRLIDAPGKKLHLDAPAIQRLRAMETNAPLVVVGDLTPVHEPLVGFVNMVAADMQPRPKRSGDFKDDFEEEPAPTALPPQVANVLDTLRAVDLAVYPEGDTLLDLRLGAADEEGAELIETTLKALVSMGRIGMTGAIGALQERDDTEAMTAASQMLHDGLGEVKFQVNGKQSTALVPRPADFNKLIKLAIDEEMANRKKMQAIWNGRQLAVAAMNREISQGRRNPLANFTFKEGPEGDPAFSWRVQLLPYLEEDILFREIDRTKSWDSEELKSLLEFTPVPFQSEWAETGQTTWKMIPAPGREDIMFIEGGKGSAVPWTQPEDFQVDPDNPLAGLGEEPEGGYVVVQRDAATRRISGDELKTYLTEKFKEAEAEE